MARTFSIRIEANNITEAQADRLLAAVATADAAGMPRRTIAIRRARATAKPKRSRKSSRERRLPARNRRAHFLPPFVGRCRVWSADRPDKHRGRHAAG